jgi:hypothetical protein
MNGVIRSWICGNTRCESTFDSWEANPACPRCKCVRVNWLPGGGHIAGVAKAADAELRALADVFRMSDMNSASRDRGAKKVAPQPQASSGPVHTFAPGFSAPVNPGQGAVCVPTTSHVDFKTQVGIGNKLPASTTFPGVRSNTTIQATHKP